jgi:twinkle protein
MKYQSSNTNSLYQCDFKKGRQICPECSHTRKKKTDKCLEFYPDKNMGYCFNCNTTFFEYKPFDKKEYSFPEWKNNTSLTDKAVKYFEGRMISQTTLKEMKVYSENSFMPQIGKETECICFPYFMDGKIINVKYRGGNKSFKLHSGSELIFWNIDTLEQNLSVIITEGEIDALSFIECGFKNCLSVPNGASTKMEYLDNYMHLFDNIKIVYLAVDQDTKGIILRNEFIRRFGAERCKIVSFKECKDANEYLLKYGGIELKSTIDEAKDCPVKGVINARQIQTELRDYFENGTQRGNTIKFEEIDKYITWETGRLAIVSGEPGSGKSEFVDFLLTKLNLIYGWKSAIFTPENFPLKYHYEKIYEKLIGKKFNAKFSSDLEFDMAIDHISENMFWVMNDEDFTLDNILEGAKFLVKNKGIKILVIDPYNKIDHQYDRNITETQYISKFLDKLIMFGKLNDILVILIAHPKKIDTSQVPTLYDISGSANFYNKCDYGFTVKRRRNDDNVMNNEVDIFWQKIKFKHLGEQGISHLKYNYHNGRYETGIVDNWDNSNWLIKDIPSINNDNADEYIDVAPF